MLNKVWNLRVNELWLSWLKRLAGEADRTPVSLIRDLVFLFVFDDTVWQSICQRLKSDQVSYNK